VVVDTTADALGPVLDAGVCLIKPNVRELGELVGYELEGNTQIREAASQIVAEGKAEVVVVSLAAGGAMLVTAESVEHMHAPAVKVESKVGAGDSMVAGIVLVLAEGRSLRDSVRFGIACGAAAVMDAETGLGSRENARMLYEQMANGS